LGTAGVASGSGPGRLSLAGPGRSVGTAPTPPSRGGAGPRPSRRGHRPMSGLACLLEPIRCAHDRGACGADAARPPACPEDRLPRLRPLLAGMVLVLRACRGPGAAGAATAPAAGGQPAMAAGAFAD